MSNRVKTITTQRNTIHCIILFSGMIAGFIIGEIVERFHKK